MLYRRFFVQSDFVFLSVACLFSSFVLWYVTYLLSPFHIENTWESLVHFICSDIVWLLNSLLLHLKTIGFFPLSFHLRCGYFMPYSLCFSSLRIFGERSNLWDNKFSLSRDWSLLFRTLEHFFWNFLKCPTLVFLPSSVFLWKNILDLWIVLFYSYLIQEPYHPI